MNVFSTRYLASAEGPAGSCFIGPSSIPGSNAFALCNFASVLPGEGELRGACQDSKALRAENCPFSDWAPLRGGTGTERCLWGQKTGKPQ